jgi:hypothetical protein
MGEDRFSEPFKLRDAFGGRGLGDPPAIGGLELMDLLDLVLSDFRGAIFGVF